MDSDPKKRTTLLINDLISTLFKCISYPSDIFDTDTREFMYVADVKPKCTRTGIVHAFIQGIFSDDLVNIGNEQFKDRTAYLSKRNGFIVPEQHFVFWKIFQIVVADLVIFLLQFQIDLDQ